MSANRQRYIRYSLLPLFKVRVRNKGCFRLNDSTGLFHLSATADLNFVSAAKTIKQGTSLRKIPTMFTQRVLSTASRSIRGSPSAALKRFSIPSRTLVTPSNPHKASVSDLTVEVQHNVKEDPGPQSDAHQGESIADRGEDGKGSWDDSVARCEIVDC
jgi:hypothetical protein